jgi:hypothetical protein
MNVEEYLDGVTVLIGPLVALGSLLDRDGAGIRFENICPLPDMINEPGWSGITPHDWKIKNWGLRPSSKVLKCSKVDKLTWDTLDGTVMMMLRIFTNQPISNLTMILSKLFPQDAIRGYASAAGKEYVANVNLLNGETQSSDFVRDPVLAETLWDCSLPVIARFLDKSCV